MSEYTPDTWVVLRIVSIKDDNAIFYRLLTGWVGGYAQADAWRFNSGITRFEDDETHWLVYGRSGSVYRCGKNSYRLSLATANMYTSWQKTIGEENFKLMPEDTDWLNVNWGLKNA